MGWIIKITAVVVVVSLAYTLLRKLWGSSISDVRGPNNSASFFLGHLKFIWHSESNAIENRFLTEYGGVVRIKGPLSDRLWVADPKASHHILQATSYLYAKPSSTRESISVITDRGLVWADGEVHRRQRKSMMPAFGSTASRELLPRFVEVLDKLDGMWKDLSNASDGQMILDVIEWLSRASLDVIGKAAFEYEFGALDRLDKPITNTCLGLVQSTFSTKLTCAQMFIIDAAQYLPCGTIPWLFEKDEIRESREQVHAVAQTLFDTKRENMRRGEQGKDVLSLLIKENEKAEGKLEVFEIIAQVRTIMIAGHETTHKSMACILWELARNPESQTKLREELDTKVLAKGNADFTITELENMPYLNAVIKETLRLHSIVTDIIRRASEDDVLPLSIPIVGSSGRTYRELFIPKGTIVQVSTVGYNRNPDVWGSNARMFRPERWLEQDTSKVETPLGIYGNMLTFSAGVRGCIGWRFAIIELQVFVARLVREFQFSEVEDKSINVWRPGLLLLAVEGEEDKGSQLPLKVSMVHRN